MNPTTNVEILEERDHKVIVVEYTVANLFLNIFIIRLLEYMCSSPYSSDTITNNVGTTNTGLNVNRKYANAITKFITNIDRIFLFDEKVPAITLPKDEAIEESDATVPIVALSMPI